MSRHRRLGQHFLTRPDVARRIVESARIGPGDLVIEVGPGRGALTEHLVSATSRVVAIEMDPGLAQGLTDRYGDALRVVEADVLTVSFAHVLKDFEARQAILVANMPYRITGRLIDHVLSQAECWRHAVLMMQREVAERLVAEPGGKDYGLLTISAGLRAEARHLFDVEPEAFSPPPKVHSSVVRLTFEGYRRPKVEDEDLLFMVARTCFQRRRKMIRNSLTAVSSDVEAVFAAARIDGASRPETLSIEDFERLCRALDKCEVTVSTVESVLDRRIEPRWVIADKPNATVVGDLRSALSAPPMMAKILVNRGVEDPDVARAFLEPKLEDLIDPFEMRDMTAASARIWQAIDSNEQIMIHGDYDVDGVTGTSLLVRTLGALGATVRFYIPNRLEEGYGISHEAIDTCVAQGTTLLISVDCGITATAETLYARGRGVDVIITDHHQPGALPDAVAVVNPKRPDCDYPFKELSGVALAFKLADAVYRDRQLDPEPVYQNMDLVALGCAADIVPLVGENRILVSNGLRRMERTENEGLKALLRGVKLTGRRLGTSPLIFVLAPRINALGRMGSALDAVTMLTTDDAEQAADIAEVLETQNRVRRQVDDRMYREAVELVEKEPDLASARALVLASASWHPGVIGIVASRIAERVHLPTVLISLDGERGKGSARSIPGFDLYEAVSRCQEHLVAFGGHKYAAGLTIDRDQVSAFREALVAVAEEMMLPEDLTPRLEIDDEITLDKIDRRMVEMLRRFAPFGPQNPRPLMVSRAVEVVGAPSVVGRNHLRFKARQNGSVLDCIGYNLGHLTYRLTPGEANLDMVYVIEENEWRGRRDIQLRISDLR